jgi:hypothetical protein
MEEINIQEWDGLQYDPISDKTKVELALIDLYNRLAMQIPANHQEILNELAEKLLPQEASLTVKQVAGSLDASIGDEIEIQKLRVEANSPYNDGFTREFYDKELKRYNAGTKEWPAPRTKDEQDYMYNWIRSKSGRP